MLRVCCGRVLLPHHHGLLSHHPVRTGLYVCQWYSSDASLKNPYKVLGLHDRANKKEIKAAYIRLSKIYHPDRNRDANSTEEFQQIRSAYDFLMQQPDPGGPDPNGGRQEEDDFHHGPSSPFHSRVRGFQKARNIDDWVKNVERNARTRQKMKEGEPSSDGYRMYSDMFEPEYKKFESSFLRRLDQSYALFRLRELDPTNRALKHKLYTLGVWLYYISVRTIVRNGFRAMLLLFLILAVSDYRWSQNEFDTPPPVKTYGPEGLTVINIRNEKSGKSCNE